MQAKTSRAYGMHMQGWANKYTANASVKKEKCRDESKRKQCAFGLYARAQIIPSSYFTTNAVF